MPKQATSEKVGRQRRERGSISAEEIINGAFEVARRDTLDKLSMPELAKHLDVGVTSIYWYFRKKDDLLNAMTDEAIRIVFEQLLPVEKSDWKSYLREHFALTRTIYSADHTLCDLALVRFGTYSKEAVHQVFVVMEEILEMLIEAGFEPQSALEVYESMSVYTRGSILLERIQLSAKSPTIDDRRQARLIDPVDMPRLAELIKTRSLSMVADDDYDAGIGHLMTGFEAVLRADKRARKAADA
ncbi:TetR family transcriptional regulator [Rhodococcus cercidiphylli]|uniref:TetR family transcriptional regulator n=1 Tax=Rhodococcus cercidiphylli TaxID=489916 RepID=A0ABU4AWC2_9NOCA|nr:TetR family transcriptional regulator [Rhodococcus cercidiphylli]MDV6230544.1 TetR family transcriptional regulator [Rhodococcus cercidiphylli]